MAFKIEETYLYNGVTGSRVFETNNKGCDVTIPSHGPMMY